jgi:pyruvate/2-oxoglutarate dehydrogenase complex dihydrolipoamide dehydrogenase (E3) component
MSRMPPSFPVDEYDRRLLAEVHPPGWVNPSPPDRYDLVVLGAGTGGLVAAAGAAGLGARVALVEQQLMGGDCLNTGCVPSKALIASARAWRTARSGAAPKGPAALGAGPFEAAMTRMRRLRAALSPADGARRFAALGVDVFLGRGRFVGPDRVTVDGQTLRFRRAVIATGGRPAVPPVPGLVEAGYLTSDTVFGLAELPARLIVIGAGPIGCELAQTFARFGSQVRVFDRGARILHKEDAEAAGVVTAALAADGVEVLSGARIERVERGPDGPVVHAVHQGRTRAVAADALLVAAGRVPNVEDVGLAEAGVEFGRTGVTVNSRLQTSNPRVFAVGDVCSPHQFTHAADFQARLVIANALFFGRRNQFRLCYPRCTYTSPELAHVGLTPDEAHRRGIALETITVPFAEVDRAVLEGDDGGFLRVHLRPGTDRLLGVTIVAENAGDLIAEAAVAITNGHGLATLGRTIHPYPTRAEAYRKAADRWRHGRLTSGVRRLLTVWFRIFR